MPFACKVIKVELVSVCLGVELDEDGGDEGCPVDVMFDTGTLSESLSLLSRS